jgi:hypothetical protein
VEPGERLNRAFQQRGWSSSAEELLGVFNPEKSLLDQLVPGAFSISNSPIWQDSSTTRECKELEEAVAGAQALADITGNRIVESVLERLLTYHAVVIAKRGQPSGSPDTELRRPWREHAGKLQRGEAEHLVRDLILHGMLRF